MSSFSALVLAAILGGAPDTTILQFSSQRCQHCQTMQPIVAQLTQQGVNVQVIDVDRQLSVAQQHRINGVPTFVAISGGQEVGRIEGVTTAAKLVALVQPAAAGNFDGIPPSPEPPAPRHTVKNQPTRFLPTNPPVLLRCVSRWKTRSATALAPGPSSTRTKMKHSS